MSSQEAPFEISSNTWIVDLADFHSLADFHLSAIALEFHPKINSAVKENT